MSNAAPLFQPFALKSLKLPNRIVMAPMTRSFSPGGVPTDAVGEYYRKRAAAAAQRQVLRLPEVPLVKRQDFDLVGNGLVLEREPHAPRVG